MASSTETTVTSLKVHKVPTYDLWKTQYGSGIGVGDLVIIPPSQLQPALPTQSSSTNGKFLTNNGSGTLSWATVDALPSQSGHSGQYLTTNGTSASWVAINPLPSQTGNSGKYLTTNGTSASWVTLTIPGGSSTSPKMNGTATVGTETTWAHGDHIHPTDTTRQTKITANGILQGDGAGNITALTSSVVTLTGIGTANGVATLNSHGNVTGAQAVSRTVEMGANGDLVPVYVDEYSYGYTFGGPSSQDPAINYNCCTIVITHNPSLSTYLTINLPSLDNSSSVWNGAMTDFEIEFLNQSGADVYFFENGTDTINGNSSSLEFNEQYKSIVLKRVPKGSGQYEWNAQGAI